MSRFGNPRFLVALLLGLLIAGTITVFQFDRAARDNPRMVPFVPEGLGGFADERRGERLLADDPASASAAVADVLRVRPVDVSHLSQFALWAAETDRMELASAALSEAAKRGWRDPYVQITVLGSALATGNVEEAVKRLDALSRTEADQGIISVALDAMLQTPATHKDLAEMIGESEFLARSTVAYVNSAPPGRHAMGLIIADLSDTQDALGCAGRARIGRELLSKGDNAGTRVWKRECWPESSSEFGFAYPEIENDPRGWTFPRAGGISVRMLGNGAMTVENRDFLRRLAAWRFLTLAPGSHVLAIMREDAGQSSLPGRRRAETLVRIMCLDQNGREAALAGETEGSGRFEFQIPSGCEVQRLRIEVGRGRIEGLSVAMQGPA